MILSVDFHKAKAYNVNCLFQRSVAGCRCSINSRGTVPIGFDEVLIMMRKEIYLAMSAVFACFAVAAKDRIVVVPAHPDDLIPCFGTCLLTKNIFEWHVIELAQLRGLKNPQIH